MDLRRVLRTDNGDLWGWVGVAATLWLAIALPVAAGYSWWQLNYGPEPKYRVELEAT